MGVLPLKLTEQGVDNDPGGVVNRQQQCELRSVFPKPSVVAACCLSLTGARSCSKVSHVLPAGSLDALLNRPAYRLSRGIRCRQNLHQCFGRPSHVPHRVKRSTVSGISQSASCVTCLRPMSIPSRSPQQLAQARVVDSGVSGPSQTYCFDRQCARCSIGRAATSVAVSYCGCSLLPVCRQYAPGMACAQSHQYRCLLRRHISSQ